MPGNHSDTSSIDSLTLTPTSSESDLQEMGSPATSTSSGIPAGVEVHFTREAANFIDKNIQQLGTTLRQQERKIGELSDLVKFEQQARVQSTNRLDNLVSTLSWVAGLGVTRIAYQAVNKTSATGMVAGFAYLAAVGAGMLAHDATQALVGTQNPVYGSYQAKKEPAPFIREFIKNLSPPMF